jgi:hypothetical protein
MKEFHCPECGAPVVCTIKRAELYFYIDSEGKVTRDSNPDPWDNDNDIIVHIILLMKFVLILSGKWSF